VYNGICEGEETGACRRWRDNRGCNLRRRITTVSSRRRRRRLNESTVRVRCISWHVLAGRQVRQNGIEFISSSATFDFDAAPERVARRQHVDVARARQRKICVKRDRLSRYQWHARINSARRVSGHKFFRMTPTSTGSEFQKSRSQQAGSGRSTSVR
jgi:hypothetical protein